MPHSRSEIPLPPRPDDEPPKRIRRERTKGWRLPPNAVTITRPTKWGNPYDWRVRPPLYPPNLPWGRKEAVECFELMLAGGWRLRRPPGWQIVRDAMEELEGKDLCCWCPLDQPCHGRVLLAYANGVVLPDGSVKLPDA